MTTAQHQQATVTLSSIDDTQPGGPKIPDHDFIIRLSISGVISPYRVFYIAGSLYVELCEATWIRRQISSFTAWGINTWLTLHVMLTISDFGRR